MRTRSWSATLLVILLASAGCENGNDPVDSTTGTTMTFGTPRTSVLIGSEVPFVLDANGQAPLALVRIDFDDDGTWDETIDYGHRNFYATFQHTYAATGTVTARAEVIDADDRSTVRSIALAVIDPGPSVDITYRVDGAASDFAACYASGPPASCEDCTIPLGVSSGSGTIGAVLRGGSVSVSQTFVQSEARYESGCLFALTLLVEADGVPLAQLGRAECSTSNRLNVMSCAATVSAVVP